MLAYQLADRLGEPDPLKILSLPASVLMGWLAFLNLPEINGMAPGGPPDSGLNVPAISPDDTAAACAAFVRVMK
ncbi:hypothetical protein D6364_01520 [Salmonella enterica subsp. enterica serovar Denver]|nr:hypothetical protein [Salmonella enterica subsp. enterica serovar Denver]ECE7751951.1 hypothetical protein [Salmonella enterica subsp. enterica serovar Ngili]HAO0323833.1 hypothetical protein [Escherichia coli]